MNFPCLHTKKKRENKGKDMKENDNKNTFPKIVLIITIILYVIDFISNQSVTLYLDDFEMVILTLLFDLTMGQAFRLAIVYLGGTILVSCVAIAKKKYALALNLAIIGLDIVCIVPLTLVEMLLGIEGLGIKNKWTYGVSFILLIALLIYNIGRKKREKIHNHNEYFH